MSVTIVHGDILDADENLIVHQVNCKGVMGGGLAKQIREKWPKVYEEYKWWCEFVTANKDTVTYKNGLLGRTQYCQVKPDKWIINLFGQEDYGREKGKVYTDYDAVKECLLSIAGTAKRLGFTIAIPHGMGCGLGGGDWQGVVLPMILDIFENSDVEVKIYRM